MSGADDEAELPSVEESELSELAAEQGEEDDDEAEKADASDDADPPPVSMGASRVCMMMFPAVNPKTTMAVPMTMVRRMCGGMAGL